MHYLVDTIAVERMALLAESPRQVVLVGQRMDTLAEVRFNGVASPAVAVTSRTRAEATVPTQLANTALKDLVPTVLSTTLSGRTNARMVLQLGRQMSTVSGLSLLLQLVLRKCVLTPATNRDDPTDGIGILRLKGLLLAAGPVSQAELALGEYCRAAESQLLNLQRGDPRYTAEERLASLQMTLLTVDAKAGTVLIEITVRNTAGGVVNQPLVL